MGAHLPQVATPATLIPEGCHVAELWNVAADRSVSVARCHVPVGVTTKRHSVSVRERYLIEDGEGLVELGRDMPFVVRPGDAVDIAPDESQRIRNTGPGELVFLAVCTPAFFPACYTDLESDAPAPALAMPTP